MRIYIVFDNKASAPAFHFAAINDSTAIRSFEMLLTDPDDNVFNQNPQDFDLYYVCTISSPADINLDVSLIVNGSSYSSDLIFSKREDRKKKLLKLKEIANV